MSSSNSTSKQYELSQVKCAKRYGPIEAQPGEAIKWWQSHRREYVSRIACRYTVFSVYKTKFCSSSSCLFSLELVGMNGDNLELRLVGWRVEFETVNRRYSTTIMRFFSSGAFQTHVSFTYRPLCVWSLLYGKHTFLTTIPSNHWGGSMCNLRRVNLSDNILFPKVRLPCQWKIWRITVWFLKGLIICTRCQRSQWNSSQKLIKQCTGMKIIGQESTQCAYLTSGDDRETVHFVHLSFIRSTIANKVILLLLTVSSSYEPV